MLPCRLFSDKKKYTGFEEFVPTTEWQTVKDGQILPPGLEINVNVTTGEKQAKLKVEEDKSKRNNIIISVAAVSAVAVLGAALTF